MSDNSGGNPNPAPGAPQKRRGNPKWRPYYRKTFNIGPREKPTAFRINPTESESVRSAGGASSSNAINTNPTVAPTNHIPKSTSVFLLNDNDNYPFWHLYFPQEKLNKDSQTARRANSFEKHFKSNPDVYNFQQIKAQFWFELNLQFLWSDNLFKNSWSSFQQDLTENPEIVLACAGLSMHKLVSNVIEASCSSSSSDSYSKSSNSFLQMIRPRINGFGPIVNLRSLRVNNYDRLVAIRGTIIRAGPTEILCLWMAYKCIMCGTEQVVRQPEGVLTVPTSCKGQCRARSNFTPLLSSPYTRTEAFQIVRVQESMLGEQYDSGRVPRNIEVELTEDLVDSVCPGDDVTLTGILKVRPQEETQRKGQASMFKMYIRAVAISSNKNKITNRKSDFTEKDIQAIEMIRNEPNLFRLLVHSLCPTIYGHEMIKAGLLLGLFGASGSHAGKRTEIHVLVVGDPGVGKSQMLQSCTNVCPRGIFVCGNSSSHAGLTVSVRQERSGAGSGGALEAGALVLADQGVCCIDEFDKMSSNYQSLLEVMEQQTVSVAKAGVLCSLPARTCILAAANPVGGHYDRSRTVSENLKMNPALLSRFDLVFILLDRPNARLDSLLTKHIQSLHSGNKKTSFWSLSSGGKQTNHDKSETSLDQPLDEKLKLLPDENLDLLPPVLLQKYIAYAKKNCHPRLSPEAAQELKKFYLELRAIRSGLDAIPVTTRQLEGFIRLTQARARLELSAEATREHALDVLAIVRYSLVDVFSTDAGQLQMKRSINGSGMSQLNQAKKFVNALQRRSSAVDKTIFELSELREIATYAGLTANLFNLIDSLNLQGILLKKGKNLYKFVVE